MSTRNFLLYQNSNANNVDIMVYEPSLLFPPAAVWGGINDLVLYFDFGQFHFNF